MRPPPAKPSRAIRGPGASIAAHAPKTSKSEFVARGRTSAEVASTLKADGLVYQELEHLVESTLAGNPRLTGTCHACFSGVYPTGDVDERMLAQIESERLMHREA